MKLFKCRNCGQVLNFENVKCERCGRRLGYLAEGATLTAVEPAGGEWLSPAAPSRRFRFCANAEYDACNWLVSAASEERYCLACRHNRTVPDLGVSENVVRWRKLELAKHRLFYTMLRLGLPLATRAADPRHGLAFDFLADPPVVSGPTVITGHDHGLITIALKEADDAERERRRTAMGEQYRTLLGHFRHEVGHHFWDLLVGDGGHLEEFRKRFGDDRQDYDAALQAHYRNGPPPDWQEHFISSYASAHPWEDFAETWAHYLHMVDTLETGHALGLSIDPPVADGATLRAEVDFDPHLRHDIGRLVETWLPVAFAVNSLNRSMGQPDLYPFVLSPAVIEKLGFINGLVHERKKDAPPRH
jgi:hypothetical protein